MNQLNVLGCEVLRFNFVIVVIVVVVIVVVIVVVVVSHITTAEPLRVLSSSGAFCHISFVSMLTRLRVYLLSVSSPASFRFMSPSPATELVHLTGSLPHNNHRRARRFAVIQLPKQYSNKIHIEMYSTDSRTPPGSY